MAKIARKLASVGAGRQPNLGLSGPFSGPSSLPPEASTVPEIQGARRSAACFSIVLTPSWVNKGIFRTDNQLPCFRKKSEGDWPLN